MPTHGIFDLEGVRVTLPFELVSLPGAPEHVFESSNGLVWKRRGNANDARKELRATQLARLLLPDALAPFSAWAVFEKYFVSQKMPYAKFEPANPCHVTKGASYLARLHALDIKAFRDKLSGGGFAHYIGEAMRNRLQEEVIHARSAFQAEPAVKKLEEIVNEAIKRWMFEDDIVLGHGDFQACNLFVSPDRVWPIDWNDFGLCDRAYEVVHFLASVSDSLAEPTRRQYIEMTQKADFTRQRGIAADGIIQAGSHARNKGNLDDFRKHVVRAGQAIST